MCIAFSIVQAEIMALNGPLYYIVGSFNAILSQIISYVHSSCCVWTVQKIYTLAMTLVVVAIYNKLGTYAYLVLSKRQAFQFFRKPFLILNQKCLAF